MTAAELDAYVEALVDTAPPLTDEIRGRLRVLLAMPRNDEGAARPAAPASSLTHPRPAKVGGRRGRG